MLFTVAGISKIWAAGMTARSFGFTGHGSPPDIKKALAGFLPQRLVAFFAIIYSITLCNCNQVNRTAMDCKVFRREA
jgi:hypothetical protein